MIRKDDYSSIDPVKTGSFIKKMRKDYNMTQDMLAEKLFVSRKAISKWENGENCPSLDVLKILSTVFSVSIDEIIAGQFLEHEIIDGQFQFHISIAKKRSLSLSIWLIIFIVITVISHLTETLKPRIFNFSGLNSGYILLDSSVILSNKNTFFNFGTLLSDMNYNPNQTIKLNFYYIYDNKRYFISSLETIASTKIDLNTINNFYNIDNPYVCIDNMYLEILNGDSHEIIKLNGEEVLNKKSVISTKKYFNYSKLPDKYKLKYRYFDNNSYMKSTQLNINYIETLKNYLHNATANETISLNDNVIEIFPDTDMVIISGKCQFTIDYKFGRVKTFGDTNVIFQVDDPAIISKINNCFIQ